LLGLGAVTLAVVVSACVDAPSAPADDVGSGALFFAPQITLVGPAGPATSLAQTDALDEAFDRVDRFRMVVRRASDNRIVVDTVISVTPGLDEYNLAAPVVIASADEQFLVSLIASQGDVELFSAPPILTRATRVDAAGNPVGGAAAGAVSTTISLTYSGPGATAASVEIEPGQVVLGPGGVATVAFKVLDDMGAVIAGVPVSWTSTAAGVATVDGGNVTGVSDGISEVVVTTPTGLQASSTVYCGLRHARVRARRGGSHARAGRR
jgi:hypothetical protein